MVKFVFDDLSGSIPAMLWPEEFARHEPLIREDAIGFVRGTLDRRREPAELVVSRFVPIEQAAAELARGVVVTVHKGSHDDEVLERLQRQARSRQGGHLELYLEVKGLAGLNRIILRAGSIWRLRHDDRLIDDFEAVVGAGRVRYVGAGGAAAPRSQSRVSRAAPQFNAEPQEEAEPDD
jgi:DNA polymerase-3 subunit alpha